MKEEEPTDKKGQWNRYQQRQDKCNRCEGVDVAELQDGQHLKHDSASNS